ncbi:hypothetical protein LWI28_006004 [Acer negundo]|uniref:MATH domain-containing protein n=1 Tax=Acer negundo TaxID=4023 RepID=A0AAD5JPE7_ACENE|nr:hypothetical protein LWI28_006004 [Acer negundo]
MVANFINCFKLDRNSINVFVENIRRKIQDVAAAFNLGYYEANPSQLPASICYPETISEHQRGNSKFRFECEIKSQDGDQNVVRRTCSLFSVYYPGPDYIRSSHVIIGFHFHILRKICGNELSFRFYVKKYGWRKQPYSCKVEKYEVEKCAVHFMLAKDREEILGVERDIQPAHFTLKIESYSSLLEVLNGKDERYETGNFDAGGYKWKLILYPQGNEAYERKNHISLGQISIYIFMAS